MDSLSQRAKTDRGRTPTRERHAAAAPGPRRRVTSLVAVGQELKSPSDGSKPYSYRYIGALCPDFHRVLLYGGVW